jgi:hypothetical protein
MEFAAMLNPVNAPSAIPMATSQHLLGVLTKPEPDAVVFTFQSALPTVPMITVWRSPNNLNSDMIPQNQVTVAFGPRTTNHSIRVGGLPQATHLIYRVSVGDPARSPMPVVEVDFVNTLNRFCLIEFLSIRFLSTGDSDGGASVALNMAVYDGAGRLGEKLFLDGEHFGHNVGFQNNSIDNGQVVDHPFGGLVRIENAPGRVVPWVIMAHENGFDIIGTLEPETLPDGPTSGSNGDSQFATALASLPLAASVGETAWQTFIMSSGLKGVSFEIIARIQTIVTDPLPSIPVPIHFHPGGFH